MSVENNAANDIMDRLMQTGAGEGADRARELLGITGYSATESGVRFRFPGSWRWNVVEITAQDGGRHYVEFSKYRRGKLQYSEGHCDVGAGRLADLLREQTGLQIPEPAGV